MFQQTFYKGRFFLVIIALFFVLLSVPGSSGALTLEESHQVATLYTRLATLKGMLERLTQSLYSGGFAQVSGTAPTAPSNVSITWASTNGGETTINWTDASTNEITFQIERRFGTAGTWTNVLSLTSGSGPDTGFARTHRDPNTSTGAWDYKVKACNDAGCGEAPIVTVSVQTGTTGGTTTTTSSCSSSLTALLGSGCHYMYIDSAGRSIYCDGAMTMSAKEGDTATTSGCSLSTTTTSSATFSTVTNLAATYRDPLWVDLTWTDNSVGEDYYKISRRTAGGTWAPFGNKTRPYTDGGTLTFNDGGVTANTTYEYHINACTNDGACSVDSNTASATVPASTGGTTSDTTPPSVPIGLTASAFSSTRVDLSWNVSTDNVGVTSYKIYRNSVLWSTISATGFTSVANYSDSAASGGTSYTYDVSALDAAGNESFRAPVGVTTPTGAGTVTTSCSSSLTTLLGSGCHYMYNDSVGRAIYCDGPMTKSAKEGDTVTTAGCSSSTVSSAFNTVADLIATYRSASNDVELRWTDNSVGEDEYKIWRRPTGGSFSFLSSKIRPYNDGGIINYYDTAAPANASYEYVIKACSYSGSCAAYDSNTGYVTVGTVAAPQCSDGKDNDADGKIDYPADTGCYGASDNDEAAGATAPPVAPTNLTAVQSQSDALLTWYDNSINEDEYKIERRITGSTSWIVVGATGIVYGGSGTYRDYYPPAGSYDYQVKACNSAGCSGYSNIMLLVISGTATAAQCSDGIDNDKDGFTDYPADTSCYDKTDNDEFYPSSQTTNCSSITAQSSCTGVSGCQWNVPTISSGAQAYCSMVYAGDASSCPGFAYSKWDAQGKRYCQLNNYVSCQYTYPQYLDVKNYDPANCSATVGVSQCSDGRDNDGDGQIDYPADTGCYSRDDNDETVPAGGGAVPSTPSGLSATYSSTGSNVQLSWIDTSTNENEFKIFRKTGTVWSYLTSVGIGAAGQAVNYTDVGVPTGTLVYLVQACNVSGCSYDSNNATAVSRAANAPGISALTPASGSIGALVSVTGSGFSATGNRINFNGGVITDLVSDGKVLSFKVPSDRVPLCAVTEPRCLLPAPYNPVTPGNYAVSVTNANGTSNILQFEVLLTYPFTFPSGKVCSSYLGCFDYCKTTPGSGTGDPATCDKYFPGATTSVTPQCSDGKDNDADGFIDYPADPSCYDRTDNDEFYPQTTPQPAGCDSALIGLLGSGCHQMYTDFSGNQIFCNGNMTISAKRGDTAVTPGCQFNAPPVPTTFSVDSQSTYPRDQESGVNTLARIRVNFTREIDLASTIAQFFSLSPVSSPNTVLNGTFQFFGSGFEFAPALPLDSNTTYIYKVLTTLKDKSGAVLSSPLTRTFTTVGGVSANATIAGLVQDAGGLPLSGISVNIVKENYTSNISAVSIADGSFRAVVSPGSYWIEAYTPFGRSDLLRPTPVKVSVAPGVSEKVIIKFNTITTAAKSITGKVKFNNGNVVTDAEVSAYSWDTYQWISTSPNSTGDYTLRVVGGKWKIGIRPKNPATAVWSYSGPFPEVSFAKDNAPDFRIVDFTVPLADATLNVSTLDAQGKAISGVGVVVDTLSAGQDSVSSGIPGDGRPAPQYRSSGTNGIAKFTLISGRYHVRAYLPPDKGYLNVSEKEVTVPSGKVTDLSLTFLKRDSVVTLPFKGVIKLEDGVPTDAFVWAWSEKGGYISTFSSVAGLFEFKVGSNERWHIGAGKVVNGIPYKASEVVVEVKDVAVNVELILAKLDKDALPPPVVIKESATKQIVVQAEDGAKAVVPPNAAGSSGNVSVEVKATVEAPSQAGAQVVGTVYDVNIHDAAGKSVTSLNSDMEIVIPYDEAELKAQGVSEDGVIPSFFDDKTGTWVKVDNYTIDKEKNIVILRVKHLTRFALVAAADVIPPQAPTQLTAVALGGGKITVYWGNPLSDFKHAKVYRSDKAGELGKIVAAEVLGKSYVDDALADGVIYYYTVRAVDPAGNESNNVNQVKVTAKGTSQRFAQVLPKALPPGQATKLQILRNLTSGSSGEDVKLLQQILLKAGVYPEGLITGFFGNLTKQAVIRFQEKYAGEILTPAGLAKGTGFVGSGTRKKLSQLLP